MTRSTTFPRSFTSTSRNLETHINDRITKRLDALCDRYKQLSQSLNEGVQTMNTDTMAQISKELSKLEPVQEAYNAWRKIQRDMADLESMRKDEDMQDMVEEELETLRHALTETEAQLVSQLIPKDSADEGAAILEIRAGTGGDEAALFAADMLKMYERFANTMGWKWEVLSTSDDIGNGVKDATVNISGHGVFGAMKYESGVHRVQRVPATESKGRIHTSTITVAILPQPTEVDVKVLDSDLRVDVFRSSGAGGQHVNTTDSAVRITHIPTGIVVAMQDERSQHKNKAKALKVLRAKLYDAERLRTENSRRDARKQQVGTGDRSEKIRTYNFPQNRMTDHRINLTVHELDLIMSGQNLKSVIDKLKLEDDTMALANIE